ncbi:MAG: Hsp20/alpha crystallin family protein [Pirellulales bacterium]|nr:Hsp20/alpha crystallin family protein [Pirellulales bacterium]
MSLIPWRTKQREGEPTESSPLVTLRHEVDRLFDAFVREPFSAVDWPFAGLGKWSPTLDIAETDAEVSVRAELPGIDPKDLNVSVSGNQLVISGEKKESTEDCGKDFYHSESRYGTFRRCVTLPAEIDAENVDAQYTNGVLTLHLKKTQPAPTKRIEVKVK